MIRKIYTLLALAIIVAGCKNDVDSPTCTYPPEPEFTQVSISMINTFNYKDYLVPGFYDPAGIRVIQTCSPSTPIEVIKGTATVTDSNITVTSLSFDSLTSFATWQDCQKLEIHWKNNQPVTTIQFYVDKEKCGNNCCINYYPRIIVDGQTLNPGTGITGGDNRLNILLTTFDPTDTLR